MTIAEAHSTKLSTPKPRSATRRAEASATTPSTTFHPTVRYVPCTGCGRGDAYCAAARSVAGRFAGVCVETRLIAHTE